MPLTKNLGETIIHWVRSRLKIAKTLQAALWVGALSTLTLLSSCSHTAPESRVPPTYQIVQGAGLTACKIGDAEESFHKLFGGTASAGYLVSTDEGVQAVVSNGKIVTLFFHFSSKQFSVFDGKTAEGIGRTSTPAEVMGAYGKPEILIDGPGPLVSPVSRTRERSIRYPSKGITFTFWDDQLADIRIYKNRRAE